MGEGEGYRLRFATHQQLPWPWFVAWLACNEHLYVMREDNPDFYDGPYSNRWHARRVAIIHATAGPQ